MNTRSLARCALALVLPAALALGAAPAAQAQDPRTALAELRVEGPDGALEEGTWYVTGAERIRRSRPSDACVRGEGTIRIPGPTALGLPATGEETNRRLRQVRVRRDELGLFVCEIGSILGRPFTDPDGFAGWSYYEGFTFGSAAADQVVLEDGDRILWVYSDFGSSPVNTGPALQLRGVPARDGDGAFTVRVRSYAFDGTPSPAIGATIVGADSFTDLGDGRYRVEVGRGFTELHATRGQDIPSNRLTACSRTPIRRCPRAHGKRIVGGPDADRLPGTRGFDRVRARGGDDRIAAKAGRDRVACGPGDDLVVRSDRGDALRDCERVRTR